MALLRRLRHRYRHWILKRRYPWQFVDEGPPRHGIPTSPPGGANQEGSETEPAGEGTASQSGTRVRIRLLTWVLLVAGVALIALGIYFLVTPAHALPSFLPGHITGMNRHRTKHGAAAITLGIVAWIGAWFTT
ncbi:MAG: hypothetical protein M3O95_11675, partial [Candidatus Dormibacteraeota bacterium]|nr:hypothetical protein [Candidatus Dormibacteraeota bacterium]